MLFVLVSIGLIWDSETPDIEHIADVLECIGTKLRLQDVSIEQAAISLCLLSVYIVTSLPPSLSPSLPPPLSLSLLECT